MKFKLEHQFGHPVLYYQTDWGGLRYIVNNDFTILNTWDIIDGVPLTFYSI